MTLCIDIHGHDTMVVKLNEQNLPIQNQACGGSCGSSRTTWRECRGVIEDVPAGAVLSIYNPNGIRRFTVSDGDATLTIRANVPHLDGAICEAK
jgi:hypothetical protein